MPFTVSVSTFDASRASNSFLFNLCFPFRPAGLKNGNSKHWRFEFASMNGSSWTSVEDSLFPWKMEGFYPRSTTYRAKKFNFCFYYDISLFKQIFVFLTRDQRWQQLHKTARWTLANIEDKHHKNSYYDIADGWKLLVRCWGLQRSVSNDLFSRKYIDCWNASKLVTQLAQGQEGSPSHGALIREANGAKAKTRPRDTAKTQWFFRRIEQWLVHSHYQK